MGEREYPRYFQENSLTLRALNERNYTRYDSDAAVPNPWKTSRRMNGIDAEAEAIEMFPADVSLPRTIARAGLARRERGENRVGVVISNKNRRFRPG